MKKSNKSSKNKNVMVKLLKEVQNKYKPEQTGQVDHILLTYTNLTNFSKH